MKKKTVKKVAAKKVHSVGFPKLSKRKTTDGSRRVGKPCPDHPNFYKANCPNCMVAVPWVSANNTCPFPFKDETPPDPHPTIDKPLLVGFPFQVIHNISGITFTVYGVNCVPTLFLIWVDKHWLWVSSNDYSPKLHGLPKYDVKLNEPTRWEK